ncbi:hypothetical protein [Aldersonia kunmingensis]|uniref:hypothetical protein n=1 Tax=Aldersonia kunmingensis TaxID=408066 RepID=UPI000AE894D9|nr:hypothetical protein [Aldersonia kunmingensis]
MKTIADRVSAIEPGVGQPPWPDHEYVRGWGVFGLPFDSGHVLTLRVFPQGSFAPYITVWHRDPAGSWSIYVDGPRFDIACPRYYGAAADRVEHANIGLDWTEGNALTITVDSARLHWTVRPRTTTILRGLNAMGARLPAWTWRPAMLRHARELMGKGLGMGELEFAGVMPSGHYGVLMPQRMYLIDDSDAELDGVDLGAPTQLSENPDMGGVPLPARGVLAIGQAVWEILDRSEFDAVRNAVATAPG